MPIDKKQQREHERLEVRLPVSIKKDSVEAHGQSLNISVGGMFIEVNQTFAFGEIVNVEFKLAKTEKLTDIQAAVRWITPAGIGVQFGSVRAVDVWAINELFRARQAEAGS